MHPFLHYVTIYIITFRSTVLGKYYQKMEDGTRTSIGLLQADLASVLGVNEITIVNWENREGKADTGEFGKVSENPYNFEELPINKSKR